MSKAVHWWVRTAMKRNARADEYADVAAQNSACGHRVALPLLLAEAYGSRRADGPGRIESLIHQQGYWRPPRQMDTRFEEQPKAYPEDARAPSGTAPPSPSMWPLPT